MSDGGLSVSRGNLAERTLQVLHRGGVGNPDVLLARDGERRVVVKDFRPRKPWVRYSLGRWLIGREKRAYRVLDGLPAVPRFLGSIDEWAFALEYRPGERLSRSLAARVSPGFLDELREAVHSMHQRGVVHLDLRHRSNVLLGENGHPVIVDYASSLCFPPRGWLARRLLPALARIDRRALDKWEVRLGQGGEAFRRRAASRLPAEESPADPEGPSVR